MKTINEKITEKIEFYKEEVCANTNLTTKK
jgi:hypothetical protein